MPSRALHASDDQDRRLAGYAVERWASLVMVVVHSNTDVSTLTQWGRISGCAPTTLKTRCTIAGLRPGDSLDFARALRIVTRYAGRVCDWYNALDILDPRTMARFLERAGLPMGAPLPGVPTFLRAQRFITLPAGVDHFRVIGRLSS